MTLIFVVQSSIILLTKKGTLFTSTVMARQNDFSNEFTEKEGFQVAFAVVDYNGQDFSDSQGRNLADYL